MIESEGNVCLSRSNTTFGFSSRGGLDEHQCRFIRSSVHLLQRLYRDEDPDHRSRATNRGHGEGVIQDRERHPSLELVRLCIELVDDDLIALKGFPSLNDLQSARKPVVAGQVDTENESKIRLN